MLKPIKDVLPIIRIKANFYLIPSKLKLDVLEFLPLCNLEKDLISFSKDSGLVELVQLDFLNALKLVSQSPDRYSVSVQSSNLFHVLVRGLD